MTVDFRRRPALKLVPDVMDRLNVFPAHWIEEGRDLLETYLLANFLRLQSFYTSAAKNQQTGVMWYV